MVMAVSFAYLDWDQVFVASRLVTGRHELYNRQALPDMTPIDAPNMES